MGSNTPRPPVIGKDGFAALKVVEDLLRFHAGMIQWEAIDEGGEEFALYDGDCERVGEAASLAELLLALGWVRFPGDS